MPRKEFVRLMEENIVTLQRLGDRLKLDPANLSGFPRQQLTTLVRLHTGGRAKLKDIAMREAVTTPNLCASFRRLEKDGLVQRTIDENDRRNTWYSVTHKGSILAEHALELFRQGVEQLFKEISAEDEKKLTDAMKTMNEIVLKMEKSNA